MCVCACVCVCVCGSSVCVCVCLGTFGDSHGTKMAQKSEYANLLPVGVGGSGSWTAKIRSWLAEDIPKFDIGGFVVGDAVSEAKILMKSPGVGHSRNDTIQLQTTHPPVLIRRVPLAHPPMLYCM